MILSLLPFEVFDSLYTSICELSRRFTWRTLLHSSVIYYAFRRFNREHFNDGVYFVPNFVGDKSEPSLEFYRTFLSEVIHMHRRSSGSIYPSPNFTRKRRSISERMEAVQSLKSAQVLKSDGKYEKALKLLEHAFRLDPENPSILVALGEALEDSWRYQSMKKVTESDQSDSKILHSSAALMTRKSDDYLILSADQMFTKALVVDRYMGKAGQHRERLMPIIEEIDQRRFNLIDFKVRRFYRIPDTNPGLVQSKIEHYFKHIYHSNAIEGNTLTLAQTRSILETRLAVGGKSLLEQNEVLGLDAALRFLNSSLLRGRLSTITLDTILELHRHVLSFVDPSEAGHLRRTQVFVADHQPPPPEGLHELMTELVSWINSQEVEDMHPIELAALTHWKLVFIHPFYDGNGRTARLLMNLILMRAGIPPAIIRMEDRQAYYEHLKTANDGDVRPFIRFIATCTERTIDDYLSAAGHQTDSESSNDSGYRTTDLFPPLVDKSLLKSESRQRIASLMDCEAAPNLKHCHGISKEEKPSTPPHVIYLGG